MKILIVDDSNVIRRAIARAVGEDRYEIRVAADGREAIRAFEEFRPEIVTMDITMPEMDGLECVTELIKRDAGVRILVVSALGDQPTAVEAVKRGAHGFLLKPFSNETINEELQELLLDDFGSAIGA